MRHYLRFVTGLSRYFCERLEPAEALDEARLQLRRRIGNREVNFLHLVE